MVASAPITAEQWSFNLFARWRQYVTHLIHGSLGTYESSLSKLISNSLAGFEGLIRGTNTHADRPRYVNTQPASSTRPSAGDVTLLLSTPTVQPQTSDSAHGLVQTGSALW